MQELKNIHRHANIYRRRKEDFWRKSIHKKYSVLLNYLLTSKYICCTFRILFIKKEEHWHLKYKLNGMKYSGILIIEISNQQIGKLTGSIEALTFFQPFLKSLNYNFLSRAFRDFMKINRYKTFSNPEIIILATNAKTA